MDTFLAALDDRIVVLALAIAMLASWGLGRWMGRSFLRQGRPRPSKFDDASTALMSLLLAFSFGTSIAKHDARRLAVVSDSNAIGDFYTCAGLLKEPIRTQLQSVVEQYAQLRLDVALAKPNSIVLQSALNRFDRMQGQMAQLVARALTDGTPIAVSLTNTLNGVSSNQASRLAAVRDRLPASIVVLLFASAVVTALLIGREQGSTDNPESVGALCFILLVSLAVFVTLDLNRPDRGLIQVSQEPIERLVSSMHVDHP